MYRGGIFSFIYKKRGQIRHLTSGLGAAFQGQNSHYGLSVLAVHSAIPLAIDQDMPDSDTQALAPDEFAARAMP